MATQHIKLAFLAMFAFMEFVSIIIVSYNSSALLRECLASLYPDSTNNWEIIVVDNCSKDDTLAMLNTYFPRVNVLQMNYNAGFARANNAGIKHSSGEIILLLNPDVILQPAVLKKAMDLFLDSPCIACGIQLLNEDGTPQISGNYATKGGLNYLLPLPYAGNFLRWIAYHFTNVKPHAEPQQGTTSVDWINGAFLMVKRTAINKAGLLDEDFFLYAEEAEWCSRLKKVGPLCIFGDLTAIHLQGEIAGKEFSSPEKGYYNVFNKKGLQIMVSNFLRIRKEFGAFWFFVMVCAYLFEIPVFAIGLLISTCLQKKRYSLKHFTGYCKNVFKLIRMSPIIFRNKPYFYKVL